MPRKSRLVVPGHAHHIVDRSHNGEAVFLDENDYRKYLRYMVNAKHQYRVQVLGWCLLPHAVHLLLRPVEKAGSLSRFVQYVSRHYSRDFNLHHGHDGTLWSGRFRCAPVEPGQWRLADLRFIELLPVWHGLTRSPGLYPWSSLHERNGGEGEGLLNVAEEYLALGGDLTTRRDRFRDLLALGYSERERERIEIAVQRNQYIGGPGYADELERLTGQRVHYRGRGRPRKRGGAAHD